LSGSTIVLTHSPRSNLVRLDPLSRTLDRKPHALDVPTNAFSAAVRCLFAAFLVGIGLTFTACEDSSSVGLGVGPDTLEGGRPVTQDLLPSASATIVRPDITSNVQPNAPNGHRILVGTVTDPIVGTIQTRGHIDVAQSSIPTDFERVDAAELVLIPEYRYGTTAEPQGVTLHRATDEIQSGLTADSDELGVGDEIVRFSFVDQDTSVTVPLPDRWVNRFGPDLLNENDFENLFRGFVLQTESGNRVTGFDRSSSFLRLIDTSAGTTDTLTFSGAKSFSRIVKTAEPTTAPPPGRAVLIDGVGQDLAATFDFFTDDPPGAGRSPFDELGIVPVARAEFFFPPDTTALKNNEPANFGRPSPQSYLFQAQLADGQLDTLSTGQYTTCLDIGAQSVSSDSTCVVPVSLGTAGVVSNSAVTARLVERALAQLNTVPPAETPDPLFRRYFLELEGPEPSITPVLIATPNADPASSYRLVVTITPQ